MKTGTEEGKKALYAVTDTYSLGGGTRESCCSIRSILRGRESFPFLFFPLTGSSTTQKNRFIS